MSTILVGVALAYLAWSALSARAAFVDARAQVPVLRTALVSGDDPALRASLHTLRQDLARAHARTSGPVWGALEHLPVLGDDVRAVRTVAAVGDQLLAGAPGELAQSSTSSWRRALTPRRGRLDLKALQRLAPTAQVAATEVAAADTRLDELDSAHLTRWVRPGFVELRDGVSSVAGALRVASDTLQVLPSMLGDDRPRVYALLTTNNAEVRATGGLIGAILLVRVDHGALRIVGQTRPTEIGQFDGPVLAQSAAEKRIYYSQIAEYPQDTNFTPEFPRTAALVREMLRRSKGVEVDGVISVDTVFLSYLLRATGPLTLSDGTTLTPDDSSATLLNRVYLQLPTDAAQNAFFDEVATRLFTRLVGAGGSPVALVGALRQGISEGRVYLHDFNPAVQSRIDGTAAAGDIVAPDQDAPQMGVYLNDATGSKMSFYLRKQVSLRSESCAAGTQLLSGKAVLSYPADTPPVADLNEFITGPGTFGTPKGQQLVLVRLYGPVGGDLVRLTLDGQRLTDQAVVDRGRPVSTVAVLLERGHTVRLSWTAQAAAGQRADPVLSTSPGMESVPAVTSVASSCAA